jgi:hypothetical protein
MRASSSKIVHPCYLAVRSRCPTYLSHMSLITLACPIRTIILQLRTSLFGGMQIPRWLSIATCRRALATSKEQSLVSLFFLSMVLEAQSCLSPEFNPTRRYTKLLSAIFPSVLVLVLKHGCGVNWKTRAVCQLQAPLLHLLLLLQDEL